MSQKRSKLLAAVLVLAMAAGAAWWLDSKRAARMPAPSPEESVQAGKPAQEGLRAAPEQGGPGSAGVGIQAAEEARPVEEPENVVRLPIGIDTGRPPAEDHAVPWGFVTNLATYCAEHFQPSGTRENPERTHLFAVDFKSLNIRYGVEPEFFGVQGQDVTEVRTRIFEYLLGSGGVRVVWGAYARYVPGAFVEAAGKRMVHDRNGRARHLSPRETKAFLNAAASFFSDGAGVFTALAADGLIMDSAEAQHIAAADVRLAYEEYAKAEQKGGAAVERASRRIKEAILARDRMQNKAITGVRARAGREIALADDDVLYIVKWAARRSRQNRDWRGSMSDLAMALDGVSKDLRAASGGLGSDKDAATEPSP